MQLLADLWKTSQNAGRDDVKRIKDACDIVRIIGENVAIKPKGREYVCLCPFHDDHNPSMRVIPSKQIFHCFVCGTGGDVFSFVQKFHKMDFVEALTFLSEKTGVQLTPRRSGQPFGEQMGGSGGGSGGSGGETNSGTFYTRRELLELTAGATSFFRTILSHPTHGAAARAIIEKRQISPEMVDRFQICAAPDRWDGLILFAQQKNWKPDALFEAGLLKKRESSSGYYDLFRNRLLFPIHDKAGRVIAFGGRKINEADEPKYINSPDSRLFNKSATLYALHLAAKQIQAQKTAIVTEGYMDALACHQGGFTNAIATLGTALTREHAAALRPLCDTVVLLFDGDDAGRRAADRAVPIFFAEPIDVKIATLGRFTDAKDPDELLKREGGAAIFKHVIAQSTDLLEYRFARVRESLVGAGVAALSKALLAEIDSMVQMGLRDVEPVRQKLIIKRLAELGDIDEPTIRKVIPAGRKGDNPLSVSFAPVSDAPAPARNLATTMLAPAEHILGCILCEGQLWAGLGESDKDLISPMIYADAPTRALAQCIMDVAEDGLFPTLANVLAHTDNEDTKAAAVCLASRLEMETELHQFPDRLRKHWSACIHRLRLDALSRSPHQNTTFLSDEPSLDSNPDSHPDQDSIPPNQATSTELKPTPPSSLLAAIERAKNQAALGANRRILPRKT